MAVLEYYFVTKNVKSLIPLIDSGVLLQSNIGSISGKYGKEAKKNINDLLTKKAKMVGELSPSGSYIKKLISQ